MHKEMDTTPIKFFYLYPQLQLANNQKEIAHVVDESISVINGTQTELADSKQNNRKLEYSGC